METIIAFISETLAAVPDWLAAVLAVVTAASAITALTPSPQDDVWLGRLRRLLEALALNVGYARPGRSRRPEN